MLKTIINKIEEIILENLLKSFLVLYFISMVSFGGTLIMLKTYLDGSNTNAVAGIENENKVEKIQVEVSGAVKNPGVFELSSESRLVNLLNEADGLSQQASEEWITKNINLSAKLEDSQKIYIPFKWDTSDNDSIDSESTLAALIKPIASVSAFEETSIGVQESSSNLVNINTASQEDIDSLPGIGPVYATRIIENRPYSDITQFKENSGVPKGVVEDISDLISF